MPNCLKRPFYTRIVLSGFLLLFLSLNLSAQDKNVQNLGILWNDINVNFKVSDKWQGQGLAQYRYWMGGAKGQSQLILAAMGKRTILPNITIEPGFLYFNFHLINSEGNSFDRVELRPLIFISNTNKHNRFSTKQRIGLEWRYTQNSSMAEARILDGYNFHYRLRTLFLFKYRIGSKNSLTLYTELFARFGGEIVSNSFDQIRNGINFGREITPWLNISLGYMQWFLERSAIAGTFDNRHALRASYTFKF
jgi:hypothetical protein